MPPVVAGIAGGWRWRQWSIKQRIKALEEAVQAGGASQRLRDLRRSAVSGLERGDYTAAERTCDAAEREIARRP
jgi:hypothetical protein